MGRSAEARAVEIEAQSHDDATPLGTSIEPVAFPYRMRILDGSIHYLNGHADLQRIYAVHRNTQIHTSGACDLLAGDGWRLQLRNLSVDRLRLHGAEDHELEAALPTALKHAVAELKPRGAINFAGNVDLKKSRPDAPLAAGWDVEPVSAPGQPAGRTVAGEHLRPRAADGLVRRHAVRQHRRVGSRQLDVQELSIHRTARPAVVRQREGGSGRLGSADAPGRHAQSPPDGQRAGRHRWPATAWSSSDRAPLSPWPRRCRKSTWPNSPATICRHTEAGNGKILATSIWKASRRLDSLFGSGNIHVSEANVYELPVMISLLTIVRAKRAGRQCLHRKRHVF